MTEDKHDVTRDAYDKIAKQWADEHFEKWISKDQMELFLTYVTTGKKILDVGCGPGRDVRGFNSLGYKATGIDFSTGMINEARRRVPDGNFEVMDMRNLTFKPATFDGIWCFASLLNIQKRKVPEVLSGFRRVLKKKGILALGVKRGTGERYKENYYGTKRLFAFYEPDEIRELVEKAGFNILEMHVRELEETWINLFAINPRKS